MSTEKKKRKRFPAILKLSLVLFIVALIVGGYYGYDIYKKVYNPNVIHDNEKTYLYIPTGAAYEDVIDRIESKNIIKDLESFEWVAEKKSYNSLVKPGRYLISKNISTNNDLVNLLRSGNQKPVNVSFNNVRTKEELAGKVAKYVETVLSGLTPCRASIWLMGRPQ